jgi:hypothetical protein
MKTFQSFIKEQEVENESKRYSADQEMDREFARPGAKVSQGKPGKRKYGGVSGHFGSSSGEGKSTKARLQHLKDRGRKTRGAKIKETALPAVGMKVSQSGGSEPYDIQNDEVLKRVNAFVGSIADREYLVPENAVGQLQGFLERIGLCFEMPEKLPESGSVNLPLKRYGGIFGKSVDTPFNEFDSEEGIDRALNIKVESLKNNSWKVYAKIV